MSARMNRRSVLAGIAGAFTLGWTVPDAAAQPGMGPAGTREVGVWVVIQPDDTTTIRIARSEMGQGTMTGLAQLVADELDADWALVRTEFVPPHVNLAQKRAWGDMSTGGSRGIRGSVEYVRQGGAAARAMLVQAAAAQWGVPAGECRTKASAVLHPPSGRSVRYGAIAEAAGKLPVPKDVALKPQSEWTIIGKPVARLDAREKTDGSQLYGADVRLPNMLSAAIAQCPVFGGTVQGYDPAPTLARPGVRHVLTVNNNAVAVVADTWWQAKTALEAMTIRWDEGRGAGRDECHDRGAPGGGAGRRHGRGRARDRRREGGDQGCGKGDRGRVCDALPEPCVPGADERDRPGGHW